MLGLLALLMVLAMIAAACSDSSDDTTTTTVGGDETATTVGGDDTTTTAAMSGDGFTFGMILVGPENDHGWSQAHFEAGKYIEENTGAKMISLDEDDLARFCQPSG